ncbi:hypothetical protein [Providencia sp. Me31A]|uniref:hypothetical protein n=1 Tax=Providencia sp. Me31A TaxID=3392637 RepID=UPI003D2A3956
MLPPSTPQDELIKLRVAQLERVGSILFFLIPLIILLIIGKAFAFNTLYLWQGYCLMYIISFRMVITKLSSKQLKLAVRQGWSFYRVCWCYLILSVTIFAGHAIVSRVFA